MFGLIQILIRQMDSKLQVDVFENVMQLAVEGCKAVATYIREVCIFLDSSSSLCLIKMNISYVISGYLAGLAGEYQAIGVPPKRVIGEIDRILVVYLIVYSYDYSFPLGGFLS